MGNRAEGQLLIDHSASPGLPENFLVGIGIDAPSVGEGAKWLGATLTCCHCNGIVVKNHARKRERSHCFKCNSYICDACAALKNCRPYSAVLDDAEKGFYQIQQNNLSLTF